MRQNGVDEYQHLGDSLLMSLNESTIKKAAKAPIRLLTGEAAEREARVFWHAKTPGERLAAAEQLRQAVYGYDPATPRIQTGIEITELKPKKR